VIATGRVRVLRAPPIRVVATFALWLPPAVLSPIAPARRRSFFMPASSRHLWVLRALAVVAAVGLALLGSTLTATSSGDLSGQIAAKKSAAGTLRGQIAAENARIQKTAGGVAAEQARLNTLQTELDARSAQLRSVQTQLIAARDHLVALENRLRVSSKALAANLVAAYEGNNPNIVSVILQAHGFSDLLEKLSFMQRIGHQDAQIVGSTRNARAAVAREATRLATLETRDRRLTDQILGQRNQVAAIHAALLSEQIRQVSARNGKASELNGLTSQLKTLEAKAAKQAALAARTQNAVVPGGIAIDTGGMVQPPAGAPPQVAQVIAAGNAIATLPYIWGGGHGSFQASGYDCSGSVSYALAAAGLLSSPLDSTGFESWGAPGPGRWITVYANAGHAWMTVAGWRFDTVALAETGTRWSQTMAGTSGFVVRHPPGL
jgi:peptidoglycan hydrolase CwlO-like protein